MQNSNLYNQFKELGFIEFIIDATTEQEYIDIQTDFEKMKYLLKSILTGEGQLSRMIRALWNLDRRENALEYANVQFYVQSMIDKFKNYTIDVQGDIQLLNPRAQLIQNRISDQLRDHFEIDYQPIVDQDDNQERRDNIRSMRDIFQDVIDFSGNDFNVEQLIDLTVRRNYQNDNPILLDDRGIARRAVSMQSLISYAGLSDNEFIMGQIVAFIVFAIVSNVELSDFMSNNWVFYVCKIAQILQERNRWSLRSTKFNVDFFLLNNVSDLKVSELNYIRQQLNIQDINQANFVYLRGSNFVIKPQYQILMNTRRNDDDNSNLQPGGSDANQQSMNIQNILQQSIGDEQFQLTLNQSKGLTDGLYGNVIDIISRSIQMKLNEAFLTLISHDTFFVTVRLIINVVIQIPQLLENNVPIAEVGDGQNSFNIYEDYFDKYLQMINNNPDRAQQQVQREQFNNNTGLSQHYTISFTYDNIKNIQEFELLRSVPGLELIKQHVAGSIILRISQIIFHYNAEHNNDELFDMITIAYNLKNALVKNVYIRAMVLYPENVNAKIFDFNQDLNESKSEIHRQRPVNTTLQQFLGQLVQQQPPVEEQEIPSQPIAQSFQHVEGRDFFEEMIEQSEVVPVVRQSIREEFGASRSRQIAEQRRKQQAEQRVIEQRQKLLERQPPNPPRRKAVITRQDYNAEKLMNDLNFNTIADDCFERVKTILCMMPFDVYEFSNEVELNNEICRLQRQYDFNYISIDYGMNKMSLIYSLEKAFKLADDYMILYMNDHHMFWGSTIRLRQLEQKGFNAESISQFIYGNFKKYIRDDGNSLEWIDKQKQKREQKLLKKSSFIPNKNDNYQQLPKDNLKFYLVASVFNQMKKHINNGKEISMELYYLKRVKINCFFDFETTFNDANVLENNKYVQSEFAVSMVFDIKIKLGRVVKELFKRFKIEKEIDYAHFDYVCKDKITHFELGCAAYLITTLKKKLVLVNAILCNYNRFLLLLLDQFPKSVKMIEKLNVRNSINCFSYNGAKFDNHFVLSHVKNLYGEKWIDHVTIVGNMNDMKIMQIDDFIFYDLMLMTGGGSLKNFCKDFQVVDEGKKDIDMNKMKTWTLAQINKDEIMQYVLYDSIAIHAIHKKFIRAVNGIVVDYCKTDQNFMSRIGEQDPMKLIKGQYSSWATISSLSKRIFFDYFNKNFIQSHTDEDILKFCQGSYQGGYTQAFLLGEFKGDAFYLDYNSMYPAIMAACQFPTDLRRCRIMNFQGFTRVVNKDNFHSMFLKYVCDPLQINIPTGLYNLSKNDYNLHLVTKFKFKSTCFAPCFGVRTKLHGTIYPLEYDAEFDKTEEPLVVFTFQLSMAFQYEWLEEIYLTDELRFDCAIQPVFKPFDDFMYNARKQYKKDKNPTMTTCVKLFMNSLYGKFGQKVFPHRVLMHKELNYDDEKFQKLLLHEITNIKDYKETPDILAKIDIKMKKLYDLNDRDDNLTEVVIDKIPRKNNHIGSFVYYASLITAIGRMQITRLINQCVDASPRNKVFYADTDSIIMNRDAYQFVCHTMPDILHVSDLGKMKNEYPVGDDQSTTAIKNFISFNKKIYQFSNEVENKTVIKFKGCRNPKDGLTDAFCDGDGVFSQDQNRFIRRNGNVTIVNMPMQYVLRLSRKIVNDGYTVITQPFQNIREHEEIYGKYEKYLYFDKVLEKWTVISRK